MTDLVTGRTLEDVYFEAVGSVALESDEPMGPVAPRCPHASAATPGRTESRTRGDAGPEVRR